VRSANGAQAQRHRRASAAPTARKRSAEGAQYDSQGQALSEARRVAPGPRA